MWMRSMKNCTRQMQKISKIQRTWHGKEGKLMDQKILQELVRGILSVMQENVVQIILYGSVARGDQTEESDVDVALLVNGSLNPEMEERLSDFIVDMDLKYDKVFSVIDINMDKFTEWENVLPFYQNVKKEGIVLWKAA